MKTVAETKTRHADVLPRLRKIVSREPGHSVASLGSRCESVYSYWGAPRRTVVVVMAHGADLTGTMALDDEDVTIVESKIPELFEDDDERPWKRANGQYVR